MKLLLKDKQISKLAVSIKKLKNINLNLQKINLKKQRDVAIIIKHSKINLRLITNPQIGK
jgi:hypothetical protein